MVTVGRDGAWPSWLRLDLSEAGGRVIPGGCAFGERNGLGWLDSPGWRFSIHSFSGLGNSALRGDSRPVKVPRLHPPRSVARHALRLRQLWFRKRLVQGLETQVAAGERLDPVVGLVPLEGEELRQLWEKLRERRGSKESR